MNMKNELKIKILQNTLDNFDDDYFDNGICPLLIYQISGELGLDLEVEFLFKGVSVSESIKKYIPEFNIENAFKLSEKYNFPSPTLEEGKAYWWDRFNTYSRKLFLSSLINELKIK